jgi:phosphatidylglycerophosphatase A
VKASLLVATVGGVGWIRFAPGTWGSLVALPALLLGRPWIVGLALLVAALGWLAVREVLRDRPTEDPGWVVVDETAGMLIALAALPAGAGWVGAAVGFALFRAFDILKPWPISWADGLHGATGVMLDDILAGAIVAALLVLFGAFLPGVL